MDKILRHSMHQNTGLMLGSVYWLYRDNGKENGGYRNYTGVIGIIGHILGNPPTA